MDESRASLDELLALFAARSGHFRFESGHHGDLWLDIPAAYIQPNRLRRFAAALATRLAPYRIDATCGPLVEGAFLAQMIAEELGVEFYFAEQVARATADGLYPVGYRIPPTLRDGVRGKRVAVVDDVINAGSAVGGAVEDIETCGGKLACIGSLMTLGLPAAAFAHSKGVALEALAHLARSNLWQPSSCPLCAAGAPLEGLTS